MKNLGVFLCFMLLKCVVSEDNATTTTTPATAASADTASTVTPETSTTPEIVVTTTLASSTTSETVTTTVSSSANESTTYSYADLPVKDGKVVLTDEEWKKRLTEEQYHVTRESGTERSFTGSFYKNKKNGTYTCVCCGQELFSSEHKFDSGTGWPSYFQPIRNESIVNIPDNSHGMTRTETQCSRCNAHLGHVFTDGPKPTGLRYCINSVSLNFVETK